MLLLKKPKQPVSFSCQKIDPNCNYVYWYQKKEGEPLILILRIQKGYCTVYSSYNHPQKDDFSAMRQSNKCILKIKSVKVSHSATYYCTCWDSGTHTSNPDSNVKTTLLCLARDMFPDLVKISWKMEDANGRTVEAPKAETEVLEQREKGQTTSMIIIDEEKAYRNKYICSVEHNGVTQDVDIRKEEPTKAPRTTVAAPTTLHVTYDSFQSTCSLNLASLAYTVMIVKSMVYCCGLSLLLHHRNLGSRPSTGRPIH
ncbi:unnamed protein product, partial [Coregonus sp. 'balchen']